MLKPYGILTTLTSGAINPLTFSFACSSQKKNSYGLSPIKIRNIGRIAPKGQNLIKNKQVRVLIFFKNAL